MATDRRLTEQELEAAKQKYEQLKEIPGAEELLKGLYLAGMIPGAANIQKVERGHLTQERGISPNYPTCPDCAEPFATTGPPHKCRGYIVVSGAPKWLNNQIKKDHERN